jgi:hypothetical protein
MFEEKRINIKSTFYICYINGYIMKFSLVTDTEYDMFKKKLANLKSVPHTYFFKLH